MATFDLDTPVDVEQDDVIGFYGQGVPLENGGTDADIPSTPASADASVETAVAPAEGDSMTIGDDSNFPLYSQDRTYSFAATVTPTSPGDGAAATATVDPKTGGVSGITITDPGSGYATPPVVAISSPGITPTGEASAHATISPGVVTDIEVAESGFGFTTPTVDIADGGTPSTPATAQASGGVDDLTIVDGGSGYTVQPILHFSLPDADYCANPDAVCEQPTATATMSDGAVTGVEVLTPGSGYKTAPSIDVYDGGRAVTEGPDQGPATVTSTINIGRVDITDGGAGYDSVPTVTLSDSVAPADKGASAVATVAVLGAVTDITVDEAGSGYLTPGLKKFVDTLPGDGEAEANNMGQYIPIAVPDTTTYPGTDYYEIALVQYREKFSSSMPGPGTLLRGYVQLSTSVVPGKHVDLSNANLDPTKADTPIADYFGVDDPHYLGPTIVAKKDRPTRVLFRNLLPTGKGGDLFLPVDTTLMGSGEGPDAMELDANDVPMDMAEDQGTVTDGVRNPMCSQDPKPETCYSENRATVHLHGGITPWISDGTPHQWTTPSGEATNYPKGVSVQNVPDMPDPGPGAETFFYTNQQSARLLFYHDHAWGITRLNVYAGQAAPYLITDDTEQKLIGPGGALEGVDMGNSGLGHSLTIEDKTFVPSKAVMDQVDPTWNYDQWGGEGNLWVPHVYMPAQNPGSATGVSPFGRWMYGPWFWPPSTNQKYPPIANPYYDENCDPDVEPFCEPPQIPSTPNVSVGMEAFNDTPIVNGTAYPKTTVDPKAYRYRILNAANDRSWNLSWFVADPTTGTLSEVALKKSEVEAAQSDPVVQPTVDQELSPKGPAWIQIGNDSGFLPAPAVMPAQDVTYITDPTRFDVGNLDQHSLLLAPAERADVIVDFSQYRGKTLILYNDAPAAVPARVPGYDYYTNGPDQTPVGAPTTLPGYGPNTRTIMQVKVSNAAPAVAFDRPNTTNDKMGALEAAFAHHEDGSGVFESGQHPVIVGQQAYNSAYGSNFVGTGDCSAPTNPSAKCDGFARINQQGGMPFKFDTLSGNQISIPLEPKGIHDETNAVSFDPYGRMTAQLGVEAQGATPLLQNIILYPYVNPATEVLDATNATSSLDVERISTNDDGTQIWKITHNGVDTHPIHWHLYDVQLINRVTWDNIIIPPDPNELGWKDTIRVSPLEDTYVAVRPILPTIPWGVPDSKRPLNPMMPIGAKGSVPGQVGSAGIEAGFNNTDVDGNPIAPIVNEVVNFNWEYVWHCHILSHEEMDMMRPQSVKAPKELAEASVLTAGSNGELTWTDPTPVDMESPASWTLTGPAAGTAEIGYRVERATVTNGATGSYSVVGKTLANKTSFTDTTQSSGVQYMYRVVAFNAAGDTVSNVVSGAGSPGPQVLSGVVSAGGAPVANAWVGAWNSTTGVSVMSVKTNASGAYTMALPSGDYKVNVFSPVPGYPSQWVGGANFATASVTGVNAATTLNISLVASSPVLSGVVSAGGAPVANAWVGAWNSTTGVSVISVKTNASGAYTMALPSGDYKVNVFSPVPGYPSQWVGGSNFATASVTGVNAATTLNISLVASSPVLSGVVSAGGAPVANAWVGAWNSTTGVSVMSVKTNASGAYTMALPSGDYKVNVFSPVPGYPSQWVGGANFATASVTGVNAATTLNISLVASSPVLSGVVSAGGAPVANAWVGAWNSTTGVSVMSVKTNASGAYTMALPSGDYKVNVFSPVPGYPSQWVGGANFATASVTGVNAATTLNIDLIGSAP